MSRQRKIRQRKEKLKKRILFSVVGLIILGAVIFVLVLVYFNFFAKKSFQSFIPEDPLAFISVTLKRSEDQDQALKKLGLKFGSESFFEDYLENILFPGLKEVNDEEFKAWRGEKVAFGNIKLSPVENVMVFLIEVKNVELAKEFLDKFNTSLEKKGNVINSETFRDYQIVDIKGPNEIAYSFVSNYLLISERADGIKKMIDTSLGRFTSLANSSSYWRTMRRIKNDKALAFGYFDLIEFLKMLATFTKVDKDTLNQLYSLQIRNYIGVSLIPTEEGIRISGFTERDYRNNYKKIKLKPVLAKNVPDNAALFIEGNNFGLFLEGMLLGEVTTPQEAEVKKEALKRLVQFEGGFDLDEDLLKLLDSQYAIVGLPPEGEKNISVGIIFDVKDKSSLLQKMERLERATVKLVNKYLLKEGEEKVNFTEHSYKNVKYRYLNLPDRTFIDINYALVSGYWIITTSEKTMEYLIDGINNELSQTLKQNQAYQDSFEKVEDTKAEQLIYCDIQTLLKSLDQYIQFDYDKLDKKAKVLDNLGMARKKERRGDFFDSFITVK